MSFKDIVLNYGSFPPVIAGFKYYRLYVVSMGKQLERTYRVINTDDDVVLLDLDMQHPLYVESSELTAELVAGNTIDATVTSKDYIGEEGVHTDGVWELEEYSVQTKTRFHYVENPDTVPSSIQTICDKLRQSESTDSYITSIKSGDDVAAVVSVSPTNHAPGFFDELKNGLRNVENEILNNFGPPEHEPNTPPYEVIFMNLDNEIFVAFYFNEFGTQLAQKIASL